MFDVRRSILFQYRCHEGLHKHVLRFVLVLVLVLEAFDPLSVSSTRTSTTTSAIQKPCVAIKQVHTRFQ